MSEAYLSDPLWNDAPEYLPSGDVVLVRDISKALSGMEFKYYPGGEGMPEDVPGVDSEVWAYYFDFFLRCEAFGLPHGTGWINELPWVTGFLLHMRQLKAYVEVWNIRKGSSIGD